MRQIRKISIGKDYPDGAMHYQVGKTIRLQSVPYQISHIIDKSTELKSRFDVFITNEQGTVFWKSVEDMPIVIENNVNFE